MATANPNKPGNISTFLSYFKRDLARPCNFEVEITPTSEFFAYLSKLRSVNSKLSSIYTSINQPNEIATISRFRCEQAELPPRAFTLVQQKTYGPLEEFPIQNVYNKCSMTFICSDNMVEKLFFDLWMETICTSHPDFDYTNNNFVRFDFAYKSTYRSDIIVRQLDVTGNYSYAVGLRDAFPTEVYSLPLSWSQQNDYHRLNVVFTYRYSYPLASASGGEQPS